ncbi:PilW family protein [Nitrococcus mobilis]|uniref:Type IV pilus assembly protein PilW n=1 Tax=Nitrococcus mobilis Nb-231 TaxID=314278 RepID=A4BTT5_9GAMM|nr:PilW family protein [Nitrococcus mobilis]EAR20899.1 type IV pilus assembly protein PilW [Nitrococcus mobilis Nb-231]
MAHVRRSFPSYAAGFSLVEIMVALTLSLLLLGAVFQIFISAKTSYRMNEGLARLQETGRFAADILAGDIRMAGYQGCMTLDQLTPNVIVKNPPSELLLYDPANLLRGQNNLASGNALGAVVGSDSLSIRKASTTAAHLTGNMTAVNANIQIDGNPSGFKKNDILMITDCANADIFQASSVSNGSGTVTIAHASNVNTTNNLSKAYQSDARLMAFESSTYYVADTTRTNEAGEPIYALYVRRLGGTPVELVAGVEDMQVLYGEDGNADGSVDSYANAGAVADFANVLSVRVALLVDSVSPASTQPDSATYTLLDETVNPPNGRYLRKVFTLTATTRSRELRSTTFN